MELACIWGQLTVLCHCSVMGMGLKEMETFAQDLKAVWELEKWTWGQKKSFWKKGLLIKDFKDEAFLGCPEDRKEAMDLIYEDGGTQQKSKIRETESC